MAWRLYLGLALGGLPLGALYALQAMGIVLVYRTTKVFSFAQSGLAVLAAFLTASCVKHGIPVLPAALIGVTAAVACGVAIEVTTVRYTSGPIQKTVVTLGWLLGLQGVSALMFGLTGSAGQVLSSSKAVLNIDSIGLTVTQLDLGIYLLTLTVGIVLALLLSRTSLGTAMRGVSDDPEAARLLGLPVDRVSMLSWGLGGALAGLSGVLAAPRLGLDQTQLLVFSVASIAVALVARLE